MQYDFDKELSKWTSLRWDLAEEYQSAREAYETLNGLFRVMLSERIKDYQENKKNIGFEMAMLNLLSEKGTGTKEDYKDMLRALAKYKSLRYKIEAVESKIMSIQSLMKHYRTQDGGN